ncbi:MAG: hypothetical protein HY459_03960 [Parcubacteria group bacterium]|nr:hypothetical protein [Parcubacteria group bacterium]
MKFSSVILLLFVGALAFSSSQAHDLDSEVVVSEVGFSGDGEGFIELFAPEESVSLSDWTLEIQVDTLALYPLSEDTVLNPQGYFTVPIASLPRDGGVIRLVADDGDVVASLSYPVLTGGIESYSRLRSGGVYLESAIATPGVPNKIVSRGALTSGDTLTEAGVPLTFSVTASATMTAVVALKTLLLLAVKRSGTDNLT